MLTGSVSPSGRGAVRHAPRREDGAEGPILPLLVLLMLTTVLLMLMLTTVLGMGMVDHPKGILVGVDVPVGGRGVEAGNGVQSMRLDVSMREALQGSRRRVAAGRPGRRNRSQVRMRCR